MEKQKGFFQNKRKAGLLFAILGVILLAGVIALLILLFSGGEDSTTGEDVSKQMTLAASSAGEESRVPEPGNSTAASSGQSTDGTASAVSGTVSGAASDPASEHAAISSNAPAGSGQPVHVHSWKDHTAQRWVSEVVTVVDEPEKTVSYDIYRMYWYNTREWEETRDPERFDLWNHDREGGPLSPNSINMAKRPEDCPLFLGYNDLGQPTYQGDHAIIGPYYETIPAVTHEETRGHYETYVDYQYCDCGAKK